VFSPKTTEELIHDLLSIDDDADTPVEDSNGINFNLYSSSDFDHSNPDWNDHYSTEPEVVEPEVVEPEPVETVVAEEVGEEVLPTTTISKINSKKRKILCDLPRKLKRRGSLMWRPLNYYYF
jgi:hypothetical protein